MPLLIEILGALLGGALIVVIARELGLGSRRAYGAVALAAVAVATVLAVPGLRQGASDLFDQRKEYVGLSEAQAEVEQGSKYGLNVGFISWAREQIGEGKTFDLEIGIVPGEPEFEGGGIFQGTIFAWATYQLAPNLLIEQFESPGGFGPTEGAAPEWIVFYAKSPAEYPGKLGKVITYEENFAVARNADAA